MRGLLLTVGKDKTFLTSRNTQQLATQKPKRGHQKLETFLEESKGEKLNEGFLK